MPCLGIGHPEEEERQSGSTATMLLARRDRIVVANVGDSRAVLCRDGKPIPLSAEHRCALLQPHAGPSMQDWVELIGAEVYNTSMLQLHASANANDKCTLSYTAVSSKAPAYGRRPSAHAA